MSTEKQYVFIKNLKRLLIKGYSLNEAIKMLKYLKIKEINIIEKKLYEGYLLSYVLKALKFKKFIYESVLIGEKANKLNEVISLIETQFTFYQNCQKQFNKVLLYPLILFGSAMVCFEVIRINLYPVISTLLTDFNVLENRLINFIAFNLLKIIGLSILFFFLIMYLYKPLSNILPIVKDYRSIKLIKHLEILLTCGNSLDEAFNILKLGLQENIYRITDLELTILHNSKLKLLMPYTHELVTYFKLGLQSNDLLGVLNDFSYFNDEILFDKLTKTTYYIQFSLFLILAVNIFLIYYLIMIPMLRIAQQI